MSKILISFLYSYLDHSSSALSMALFLFLTIGSFGFYPIHFRKLAEKDIHSSGVQHFRIQKTTEK